MTSPIRTENPTNPPLESKISESLTEHREGGKATTAESDARTRRASRSRERYSPRRQSRSRSPPSRRPSDRDHHHHNDTHRRRPRSRSRSTGRRGQQRDGDAGGGRSRPHRPPRRSPLPDPKPPIDFEAEQKLLQITTRTGGAYIPPARLRALQAQITDKSSEAYQRMSWDALKKSINGLINKVNVSNLKNIVVELFGENLVRGRGLFARSVIRAQQASPIFTPVYAALVAVVNTKLPAIGALVLSRLILSFQRSFRRNDKTGCLTSTRFLAHLVNQLVAHEIVALQLLALLTERPTDDSVEVAVGFMKEVGAFLSEVSPKATHATFERFRSILHEAKIDKRVQYMIEVLFQIRKDKFKDNPIKSEDLDLVEEDDQITHNIALDDDLSPEDMLDVFRKDDDFEENESKYQEIKREILGESSDEESGASGESGDESSEEEEEELDEIQQLKKTIEIHDQTETNLTNLRKTIYLTLMSSADFEEACHKLLKITLKPGQEIEMARMIVDSCSQERTYQKFYGLIGERFCKLNRIWAECFCEEFENLYNSIHRYETNRIRNIAKFYAHQLYTDAMPWTVLQCIRLSEDTTTSSSRIFIKILFQEISEAMGVKAFNARLQDAYMQESFAGLFPRDNPRDTRFAINYFTSINLGALTEDMREHLNNLPKQIAAQRATEGDSSSSDSSSEDESSSSSSSDETSSVASSVSSRRSRGERRRSRDDGNERKRRRLSPSRSPSPRHRRRLPSRSPSPRYRRR